MHHLIKAIEGKDGRLYYYEADKYLDDPDYKKWNRIAESNYDYLVTENKAKAVKIEHDTNGNIVFMEWPYAENEFTKLTDMQQQPKPKTKWKTWHKVVLGVALLLIIVAIAAPDEKNTSSDTPQAAASVPVKMEVGLNEVLHTQYFDVTVTNIKVTEKVATGNEFADLVREDGNKFLVIDVALKNTNTERRMMFDGEIIIVSNGKEYKYEQTEFVAAEGYNMIAENINPGVTKKTKLVYKIPSDAAGTLYYAPARSDSDEKILLGTI